MIELISEPEIQSLVGYNSKNPFPIVTFRSIRQWCQRSLQVEPNAGKAYVSSVRIVEKFVIFQYHGIRYLPEQFMIIEEI
jgi:hypothetical protein